MGNPTSRGEEKWKARQQTPGDRFGKYTDKLVIVDLPKLPNTMFIV
jgi:hypothetical protein